MPGFVPANLSINSQLKIFDHSHETKQVHTFIWNARRQASPIQYHKDGTFFIFNIRNSLYLDIWKSAFAVEAKKYSS